MVFFIWLFVFLVLGRGFFSFYSIFRYRWVFVVINVFFGWELGFFVVLIGRYFVVGDKFILF